MHLTETRKLAAALLISVTVPAVAQTGNAVKGSELAKVKATFLADMRKEMAPAGRQYLAELRKLERKFAIAGDYEAAIATRDERRSVERFLTGGGATATANPNPVSPDPTPPDASGIQLSPGLATVSGGATVADGAIQLSASGAKASWPRGSIEPGGYEVEIRYSAAAETTVQAKENFFRLSAKLSATRDGKVTSASLGTLKITSRAETISLSHTGTAANVQLVVHSVRLISAKD